LVRHALPGAVLLLAAIAGCGGDKTLAAPTVEGSTLAPSEPKSKTAKRFVVDAARSHVGFTMEAPLEKIRGNVDGGISGELFIDQADLAQTTGSIVVDAAKLDVYQRTRSGEGDEFADEKKNPMQNTHARQWLEIDPSAPADIRTRYSRIEFAIRSVSDLSATDLTKMTGAERKVSLKAKGDFLLHGRMKPKDVSLDVVFQYDGDRIVSASIKTASPFPVGLAEFDVRPKTRFGVLAEKTLEVLSPKVAHDAPVAVDLVVVPESAAN